MMDIPPVKHDSRPRQLLGEINPASIPHSTFVQLPVEILNIILDNLQEAGAKSALASVAQTCHHLKDVAFPILWKDVYWDERYLTAMEVPKEGQPAKTEGWIHIERLVLSNCLRQETLLQSLQSSRQTRESEPILHHFPRLQHITLKPHVSEFGSTKEWVVLLTSRFPIQPSVSDIWKLVQPVLAASTFGPSASATGDRGSAFEFGCSSCFEVHLHREPIAAGVGGANRGLLANYKSLALVCLPGIGRIRLRRWVDGAQENIAEVTYQLFLSFNDTYRLWCSEKQARHLFNLKVYVASIGDIIPWLSIMFARYRMSETQSQPYDVQFMLEKSAIINAQNETKDLLARINSYCECPKTRRHFPSKMRLFGEYTLPEDDTPMGYVEMATFVVGEDQKVCAKVWESQYRAWCGEDWHWD